MRGNHVHPVLLEVVIEPITVIRAIANEMFGLGLQHVEVETELHQGDLLSSSTSTASNTTPEDYLARASS